MIKNRNNNTYTKILIILLFSLFSTIIHAQSVVDILDKVQKKYSESNFKVSLKYQLYKGLNGTKLLEEYTGLLYKNMNNSYNRINNTETIITNSFFVKINHDEKALVFSKLNKEQAQQQQQNIVINFKKLLIQFEKPKINEANNYWLISMITKEFSQLPFSKISLTINKTDYSIKKQVLILSKLTDFSENRIERDVNLPRIEMHFKEFKNLTQTDLKVFNQDNYVKINNNKITVSNKLQGYDIIK